jgi:aspartyl-tRNA(Asn)/glutamyl-tRNA(Gln) amidotransferase subunit C
MIKKLKGRQTMQIDITLLEKLEKLSYLTIADEKRQEVIGQLSDIVGFVENLSELNTDGVEATFSTVEGGANLREDIPAPQTAVNDAILARAPKNDEHFFIVPKIIE